MGDIILSGNTSNSSGPTAVTIADGSDVTLGTIADAAVFGDNPGTVNAHLRGIGTILFDVWSDLLNAFRVYVTNGPGADAVNIQDGGNSITVDGTVSTGGLTDAELRATPVPVSGTVAISSEPYITDGTEIAPPAGDNVRIPTGYIGYDASPPGVGGIGRYGMAAMTNNRAQHVNLRDLTGSEVGELFNPLRIEGGETVAASGTITAAGQAVATGYNARMGGVPQVYVEITGTYSGTLTFQNNALGVGYTDVLGTNQETGVLLSTLPDGETGKYIIGAGTQLRVFSTTFTSGTASVSIKATHSTVGGWEAIKGSVDVTSVGGTVTVVQPTGTNLHVVVDAGSTTSASGSLTNNNAAPAADNMGVLPAVANAAPPTWVEGNQVLLSEDLAGNLRVITGAGSTITVDNGAGAAAVNIQDGGNSITVDGSITVSGTVTTAGGLTNNNTAPGANNVGVLPARATAADPTYVEGNQVLLSVDLEGHQRVTQGPGAALTSGWPILSGSNAITTTTWTAPSGAVNVVFPCDGYASVAMRLTATAASATIQFDVSMDGVVWGQFSMAWWATGITGGSPLLNYGPTTNFVFITNTVNLALQANLAAFKFFRVSATGGGVTAGTIVFDTAFSAMPAPTTARQIATVSGDSAPGISTWPTSASSREISVLTVRANAAAPTWVENTKEPLSSDLSGRLRVLSTPVASPGVIIGTVAIDQTTPGTTNLVAAAGTLTNNNAAPAANNVGALVARATAAAPAYTEGNQVLLSTDLTGNQRTIVTRVDLTPSAPAAAVVGVASAQVVAANANRKGLILTNTSTGRISLGFGSAAVLLSGVTLYPGGAYYMDHSDFDLGAVNAIASIVACTLAIQEYTT